MTTKLHIKKPFFTTRTLLLVCAALALAWGAVTLRPGQHSAPATKQAAARETANGPAKQPPMAASVTRALPAKAAPEPTTLTLEQAREFDSEALARETKQVDERIEQAGFVERANAGQLGASDMERFRTLLQRRNALQISKTERLIASLATASAR